MLTKLETEIDLYTTVKKGSTGTIISTYLYGLVHIPKSIELPKGKVEMLNIADRLMFKYSSDTIDYFIHTTSAPTKQYVFEFEKVEDDIAYAASYKLVEAKIAEKVGTIEFNNEPFNLVTPDYDYLDSCLRERNLFDTRLHGLQFFGVLGADEEIKVYSESLYTYLKKTLKEFDPEAEYNKRYGVAELNEALFTVGNKTCIVETKNWNKQTGDISYGVNIIEDENMPANAVLNPRKLEIQKGRIHDIEELKNLNLEGVQDVAFNWFGLEFYYDNTWNGLKDLLYQQKLYAIVNK